MSMKYCDFGRNIPGKCFGLNRSEVQKRPSEVISVWHLPMMLTNTEAPNYQSYVDNSLGMPYDIGCYPLVYDDRGCHDGFGQIIPAGRPALFLAGRSDIRHPPVIPGIQQKMIQAQQWQLYRTPYPTMSVFLNETRPPGMFRSAAT